MWVCLLEKEGVAPVTIRDLEDRLVLGPEAQSLPLVVDARGTDEGHAGVHIASQSVQLRQAVLVELLLIKAGGDQV